MRKFRGTATDYVDGTIYRILDVAMIPAPDELDEGSPPSRGIFDGLEDNGLRAEDLDPGRVPRWIDDLRRAEADLRTKRLQLEALLADRSCPTCDSPIAGRADRVYCSTRCRVAAHRRTTSS